MTFDKFTIKAQEAIQEAVNLVQARGQQAIEPEHLLAGILKVGENVTNFLFQKLGVNSRQIEQILESQIASLPKVQGGEPYLSRESNEVLTRAQDYASKGGDEFVSLEPMLLALLTVKSTVSRILKDAGITEQELASAVNELRKGEKVTSQNSEDTYQALNKYAKNLIEEARSGKLDPVIGRDEEIRRVLQILSRRTKNNPILIGEPGTGKTAIVEVPCCFIHPTLSGISERSIWWERDISRCENVLSNLSLCGRKRCGYKCWVPSLIYPLTRTKRR